jgi:hypothetical protein
MLPEGCTKFSESISEVTASLKMPKGFVSMRRLG